MDFPGQRLIPEPAGIAGKVFTSLLFFFFLQVNVAPIPTNFSLVYKNK